MLSASPGSYPERLVGKAGPWDFLIQLIILSVDQSVIQQTLFRNIPHPPQHWALG